MTGLRLDVIDRIAFFSLMGTVISAPVSPALSEIFAALAILSWSFTLRVSVASLSAMLPVFSWLMLILFVGWAAVSSAMSAAPIDSLSAFVTKWLEWLCLSLVAMSVLATEERILLFFKAILIASFVMAADGLWQVVFLKDIFRHRQMSAGIYPTASFSYYTHFAAYSSMLFLIGLSASIFPGLIWRTRVLLTLHHALFLTMILLTFSRGAWAGTLAGFLSFALLREKRLIWIGGLCLAALFVLYGKQLSFRIFPFHVFSPGDYRPEIWRATLQMIHDHPMLGIGINQYSTVISSYSATKGYAHNSYLQVAAETGIAGFVFLSGWIGSALLDSLKKMLSAGESLRTLLGFGVFAGLIAFLAQSFLDNLLLNNSLAIFFWILFGALMAIAAHCKKPFEVAAC